MSRKKIILATISIVVSVSLLTISSSYGHGLGYEVLPPVKLGDKQVSLEVTSSQYSDPDSTDRQITLSLFDIETGVTIQDVTFHIIAKKANQFLFDETFRSDNGVFTMNFLPTESDVMVEEEQSSFFDSLVGLQKDIVNIRGSPFSTGGLYTFQVKILTAENYSNELEEPLQFDVGLSIPDRTYYEIIDPNFGSQELSVITYYDKIEDFNYDPKTQTLTFRMPFNWSIDNINQTSVVHEEITIPKTFGDLMVSSFQPMVNDLEISEYAITLDGFSEKTRIIHLILNQNELFSLSKNNKIQDEMRFLLKPSEVYLPLETVTGNGQFRITFDWEPRDIKSGSKTTFYFDITDVFLRNRPVIVSYDVSIIQEGKEIFTQSGTSTGSKDHRNKMEFVVPEDVTGPITVQFDNLDGNSLARVGMPVVVNRINGQPQNGISEEISIPDWVRNNAQWWSQNQISDKDFASGIEFLIKEDIIRVPPTSDGPKSEDTVIPDWVRSNAGWWSEGLISDKEFANGLQYLIKNGIISV